MLKKIVRYTTSRIFADIIARLPSNLGSLISWIMLLLFAALFRQITIKRELMKISRSFFQLLPASLKCAFEHRHVDRSNQPRVNCCVQVSLYIWFPRVFFYTSRSTWHITECRNAGSIYAAIALVVYVAIIRHMRSRTCRTQTTSYIDRRNGDILIAIYCQNQSANLRGVITRCYNFFKGYTSYLTKNLNKTRWLK